MLIRPADLPGQSRFTGAVRTAFQNGRTPQSLLITGREDGLLQAAALWVAQAILCGKEDAPCGACPACQKFHHLTHPDLHIFFPSTASATTDEYRAVLKGFSDQPFVPVDVPETADILISSVRDVNKLVTRPAFEGNRQVVIFLGADRFRKEAANAFLKTLEEPPAGTYFILCSSDTGSMLQTILSRCQRLNLDPVQPADIQSFLEKQGIPAAKAKAWAVMCQGQLGAALRFAETDAVDFYSELAPYLTSVYQGNLPGIYDQYQVWEKSGKDGILACLTALTWFFQDVLRVKSGAPGSVTRPDLAARFDKLYQDYSRLDLSVCLQAVDEAMYRLQRNVHTGLTLLNLAIQFRKLMREKK
ncbi:MAG: hypothetical protein L6Q77_08555 [Bacteroidetes bacterium]|nr:hypothetical protein [Bacteroidota bacterium]